MRWCRQKEVGTRGEISSTWFFLSIRLRLLIRWVSAIFSRRRPSFRSFCCVLLAAY